MAGPDLRPSSSQLGKGEKFLITGQPPGSLGPLGAAHRGYLWEEPGEEGLSPSPIPEGAQVLLKLQPGPAKAGEGLGKETSNLQEEKTLLKYQRSVQKYGRSGSSSGKTWQGEHTYPSPMEKAAKGRHPDSTTTACQLPYNFLSWKMGRTYLTVSLGNYMS